MRYCQDSQDRVHLALVTSPIRSIFGGDFPPAGKTNPGGKLRLATEEG